MKHNKKRNTAFLYECLVKELTRAIVYKDKETKSKIVKIIKESFNKNTSLKKELVLYKSILNNKDKMTPEFAARFMMETKKDFLNLDRKAVFNEQTSLIKFINQNLSNKFYSNFVPNYKNLATVGQFFNSNNLNAKSRLLIEGKVFKILSKDHTIIENKIKHIDNLTYKTFVDKFNHTYKQSLNENQKTLLTNYIISFADNGLQLKTYLNEELATIKQNVAKCLENPKIKNNNVYYENMKKVSQKLNSFAQTPITEKMVKEVFYIQDLIAEINPNGH